MLDMTKGLVVGAAAASAAAAFLIRRKSLALPPARRVLVAVSGTIQDGFELRKNIDYRDASTGEFYAALLIGYGVVRGVKMFFDVKDAGCREYDPATPQRVNPAMVLTGNAQDANQYALYLVDERACLNALLGEPRLLTMVPDAVRLQLDDKDTSPEVAALARAFIRRDGLSNTSECAVLAVVPCFKSRHFVPAPPIETRPDGTRLTSFRASLAAFAGLDADSTPPGTPEWNGAVAKALAKRREALAASDAPASPKGAEDFFPLPVADDCLYGTDKATARLSRRLTVEQFNEVAREARLALRAV